MNQITRKTITEFSPMWTNKQVWEFDQVNENLTFDMLYADSDIRDIIFKILGYFEDSFELWIASKGQGKLDKKHVAYLMAVIVDAMISEEICLNFRIENDCLVVTIDTKADVIDCKEFFEEFYHLATGFNYDIDTGIPDDETEAEMYLTRLQEEFDEKMKLKLGDKYLSENNDPDTIHEK